MRNAAWIVSVLVLIAASPALAEDPNGQPPPPPPPQQVGYEQQPAQPQYAAQPGEQPPQEQPVQEGRGIEYGGHLVVPIWLTDDTSSISPGIGIQGRIGWEFPGGLTLEGNIGVMANPISNDAMRLDGTRTNVWLGVGARFAFLNASAFVPFVGAGVKLNIWQFTACDAVSCADSDSEINLGANALVGAAYELSPFLAIEFGVEINAVFPADKFFGETELYLSPFLGGTLYY